jgi:hypothetical protein
LNERYRCFWLQGWRVDGCKKQLRFLAGFLFRHFRNQSKLLRQSLALQLVINYAEVGVSEIPRSTFAKDRPLLFAATFHPFRPFGLASIACLRSSRIM